MVYDPEEGPAMPTTSLVERTFSPTIEAQKIAGGNIFEQAREQYEIEMDLAYRNPTSLQIVFPNPKLTGNLMRLIHDIISSRTDANFEALTQNDRNQRILLQQEIDKLREELVKAKVLKKPKKKK